MIETRCGDRDDDGGVSTLATSDHLFGLDREVRCAFQELAAGERDDLDDAGEVRIKGGEASERNKLEEEDASSEC